MPAGQIKAPQPALTSSAGLLAIVNRSENVFTRPGPEAIVEKGDRRQIQWSGETYTGLFAPVAEELTLATPAGDNLQ